MSTVHASAAPAHATTQGHPARPPAAAAAAAPDDLFAQLLAGLQADGEPAAAVTAQELAADDPAAAEDPSQRGDPAAEPSPLLALLGIVPGTPAPPQPSGNGTSANLAGAAEAITTEQRPELALLGIVPGTPAPPQPSGNGSSADPALSGDSGFAADLRDSQSGAATVTMNGELTAASSDGSGAPLTSSDTPNENGIGRAVSPATDAAQARDGGGARSEATAPSPRAKARDKSATRPGAGSAAAVEAPRSEAAWAALREAAGHAGQAHGLRALVSAAPADTPAANAAPVTLGGATPTVATDAGGGQPSSGGQAGQAALPSSANAEPAAAAAETALEAAFGQQLQEALQPTLDGLGAQVALWQAGRQQRASLTFEDGWDEPLAVDLNVEQGVAHVSFRTDDATARQLIQTQAPQALAEALARAGLALGQVDVGARGQQGEAPAEPPRRALRLAAGVGAGVGGAAALRAGQPAARGVLDLYA